MNFQWIRFRVVYIIHYQTQETTTSMKNTNNKYMAYSKNQLHTTIVYKTIANNNVMMLSLPISIQWCPYKCISTADLIQGNPQCCYKPNLLLTNKLTKSTNLIMALCIQMVFLWSTTGNWDETSNSWVSCDISYSTFYTPCTFWVF